MAFGNKSTLGDEHPTRFLGLGVKLALLAAAVLIIYSVRPFTQVPVGTQGVLLTFGRASPTPLSPGLQWRWPIAQQIVLVPVTIQRSETSGSESASSDLQRVNTKVVLNYHIDPARVVEVFSTVGNVNQVEHTIVDPAVQEAMKATTARYTAEQLITKRAVVASEMHAALNERFARHGLVIDEFSITQFHFSPSYDAAIEAKTVAEQQVLTEQRNLQRIEVEAQQKVTRAKADADAMEINAKAQAEALRVQREQVSRELIELRRVEATLRAIEKWDGHLPNVTGGATPFIDVGQVQGAAPAR